MFPNTTPIIAKLENRRIIAMNQKKANWFYDNSVSILRRYLWFLRGKFNIILKMGFSETENIKVMLFFLCLS